MTGDDWVGDEWDGVKEGAVMLPQGVWCGVSSGPGGVGTVLEAGWFIPDRDAVWMAPTRDVETHLISQRVYDADGQLADVKFLRRTRKP